MEGKERGALRRRVGLTAVAALAGVMALGVASPAVAKKKKKKAQPAVTVSSPVPFASSATASASATCTGKTHVSGGGFAVSPNFTPDPNTFGGTGIRSVPTATNPSGPKAWTAAAASFANPSASGTFTAFARCERNTL